MLDSLDAQLVLMIVIIINALIDVLGLFIIIIIIITVTDLVDVGDVLVRGVGLKEGVQLVHLPDVGPQVSQASGDLKLAEEGS